MLDVWGSQTSLPRPFQVFSRLRQTCRVNADRRMDHLPRLRENSLLNDSAETC